MLRNVSPRLAGSFALGVMVVVFGCSGQTGNSDAIGNSLDGTSGSGSGNSSAGSASVAGNATAGSMGSSEFPCDVQQLLATKCQLCHNATPPGMLLTSA